MKRVLLISYGFPPRGGPNAQSVAKVAKGLAGRGWSVVVLTVADSPTFLKDERLLAEVAPAVEVRATYSLEPARLFQIRRAIKTRFGRSSSRKSDGPALERNYTPLPPWLVRIIRGFFIPEEKVGWTPWAVREATRIHAEEPIDVIISSGPPYTAHGIAWRVARRLNVPWLAVLMDPIYACYAFPPLTPLHAFLMRRYERKVVTRADHVSIATAGMRRVLLSRNPDAKDRITVTLANAFDPEDFSGPEPSPHKGFVVSYVGTFQLSIRPDTFLDALTRLIREDESFARDVRVRFVAPRDPETERAVAARGLDSVVKRTGFVTHPEAVAEMRTSDVLLLILGPELESRPILTTKLPEYLAAGKAVFALVPEGDAAELVRRAHAGEVVDPLDVSAATDALARLYHMWKSGSLPVPDRDVVANLSREVGLTKLDERLKMLVDSGRG